MLIAALAAAASLPPTAPASAAKLAIGAFSSVNYGITFSAPGRTTYCPLPPDWTGSDHGTVIFLQRPNSCGGVGYPSSSRGFKPNVRRFEIYYGYDFDDDETFVSAPKCNRVGTLTLLGGSQSLCKSPDRRRVVLWTRAAYSTGAAAELILTLVTTHNRLDGDLKRFRHFAETIRTCSDTNTDANGKTSSWGVGPQCPKGDWY